MHVIQAKTEKQLREAYAIRKKVFVEEQHVPIEIELDEHETNASHFVLYDGDKPVGAGRFRILDGKGKVERICILPTHRGKGAGLKIMEKIEEFARSLHIEELVLNAQTSAIPFYKKLGYIVISEQFFDAGIPHRTMKKAVKHKTALDS
ncbi:GNAT family N-acetyltransferase [Siminovitchia sp. 179-K 8D1 HS]|uniref:GNAT family N-acetyltransferase n=1 Tax=Siminovitchia sp. 179-K 8D1 HS TaxID=3142385 RepID=UPI00399EEF30